MPFTKETLPTSSFTKESLPSSTFTKESLPAGSFVKESQNVVDEGVLVTDGGVAVTLRYD